MEIIFIVFLMSVVVAIARKGKAQINKNKPQKEWSKEDTGTLITTILPTIDPHDKTKR